MEKYYIFREATQQEIPAVFALIMRRVAWMDQVGIRQWNVTKYDRRYPPDYYDGGYCGYCFVAVEAVMQFVVPEAGYVVQSV